ncbi:MAG: TonB family protein [Pseudomonadota bacterium]
MQHATGYLDTRSRHPVALIAAISLNLAAVGVMLAYNPQIIGADPPKETKFKDFRLPPKIVKPIELPKTRQTRPADPQPRADPQPQQPDITKTIIPTDPTPWPDFPQQPQIPTGETITKPDPVPVVVGAAIDPRYRDVLQPVYPVALERQEIEGKCTVRVQIGIDGRITAVELVRADNPAFFTATREQALRRWRFKPATRDGQPITSWVEKTIVFKMPGN